MAAISRRCPHVALAIAVLGACACGPYWPFPVDTFMGMPCSTLREQPARGPSEVLIRVVDPEQVTASDAAGRVLIRPDSGPADAPFAEGTVSTARYSSGVYSARAAREEAGSLILSWKSDMGFSKGARQVIVPEDGVLAPLSTTGASLGFPANLGQDTFEWTICIHTTTGRYGGLLPTSGAPTPAEGCGLKLRLATPWSNVGEAREKTPGSRYATEKYRGHTMQELCHLPPSVPDSDVVLYARQACASGVTRK